eukprot:TRINITY_DN20426_c0_g2_i1.p1 TRINITY_DN20426_c0_g2~~TRINITY_DN20426_c0_g2_i1.p1  ORF type:complete len:301 (-),score=69.18 TRINITY_DN20426_c0_g2_i1:76-978(-)
MPSTMRRLRDASSAAFERCRTFDGIKFISMRKSKGDVKAFASPMPTAKAKTPDDGSYDHLLALLSIPAERDPRERDGLLPASVPGTLHQEEGSLHHANASGRDSQASSRGGDSRNDGEVASGGNKDLAQAANEALSVAAAKGIPCHWDDDQCVHEIDKAGLKMMGDRYIYFAERCGLSLPGDMTPDDMLLVISAVEGKEDVNDDVQQKSGRQFGSSQQMGPVRSVSEEAGRQEPGRQLDSSQEMGLASSSSEDSGRQECGRQLGSSQEIDLTAKEKVAHEVSPFNDTMGMGNSVDTKKSR